MIINRTASAIATTVGTISLILGVLNVNPQNASIQPMSAVAQTTPCNAIRTVTSFFATAAPTGVNIRSAPSLSASIVGRLQPNERRSFDAWTYGDTVTDIWLNRPDARWYRLSGTNTWVASGVVNGNPNPAPPPLCSTSNPETPDFTLPVYRQDNPFWQSGFAPKSTNPPIYRMSNPNAKGNCTWYANGRSKQLGRNTTRVNRMLGNATQWDNQAVAAGIPLSRTPQVGAIAQWEGNSRNGFGHVAVVERVNSDGTILISESSYSNVSGSNWDFLYRTRTIRASEPSTYILP
jgi:surface antigen